jgi:GT2 family glycosyltransferase
MQAMTAAYEIPPPHGDKATFRSKPIDPRKIHVVVPTYNDWDGLRVTLDSLLSLNPRPLRITVANDNRFKHEPEWFSEYQKRYPSICLAAGYEDNLGPAYARNVAFGFPVNPNYLSMSSGPRYERKARREWRDDPRLVFDRHKPTEFSWRHDADWFYFTDSGCEHSKDLFEQFAECWRETGDSCVAISGPVQGKGEGLINRFMTEQGILNPPKTRLIYDTMLPQAIVTANALVAGIAFSFIGGFDETFTEAAGEDLDLGLRLRKLGVIGWAEKAVVKHEFEESKDDFFRRFKRYGSGNRRLEVKHNLPSLRARKIKAELPEFQELADLQVKAMQEGYDAAVDSKSQGKIILSTESIE